MRPSPLSALALTLGVACSEAPPPATDDVPAATDQMTFPATAPPPPPPPTSGVAATGGAGSAVPPTTRPPNTNPPSADGPPTPGGSSAGNLPPVAGWPSFGRDLANSRAAADETAITPGTVGSLREKWAWAGGAVTSTPAVVDGVVYFGDWDGSVHALDADTGAVVWEARVNPGMLSPSAAVTGDGVFIGGEGGRLFGLERGDGSLRWEEVTDPAGNLRLWGSPGVVDGLVINGVASYQVFIAASPPFQGSVVGHDAVTGEQRFKVFLTDGTGVSVWSSPAIDPSRKLAFIGTGQQYTGETPYSDALVAIDYERGELAWGTQFTAEDSWTLTNPSGTDTDVGSTPNLFEAGGMALVGVGDKAGTYYALDRDTGEIRWRAELTVGSPNGGVVGGSAYHDGVVYVCSNDGTSGQGSFGTTGPMRASLFALSAAMGGVLWRAEIPAACFGSVTYAGGVVFVGNIDGRLRAFDAADGAELWGVDVGDSIASGVSVVDGTLYVGYGWDWLSRVSGGVKAYGLP